MGSLTDEQLKDGREVAKAIAEYQVECSMHKYMGTELLDYVADEAVQIHGGYGYMEEYEVERMYRDSRIDRKSTRLNSSHVAISYAVFCLKKKNSQYSRADAGR